MENNLSERSSNITNTTASPTQGVFRIWLPWVLASAAGGAIVGALEAGGLQFLATLILAGFVVGAMQWLVLRSHLRAAWQWPLASGVGLLLGNLLNASLPISNLLEPLIGPQAGPWGGIWLNMSFYLLPLTVAGIAQWVVLRQQAGAGWWLAISAVGGLVLGAVGSAVCYAGCDMVTASAGAVVSTAVAYGTGWAAYGIVTGWLLARLLQTRDA